MKVLSLFSGAGISDYGFRSAGAEIVAHVEIDKDASDVRKRHFTDCEDFTDVRTFDPIRFRGVDAVAGGFPCQDYSVAGGRAGLDGDRGALWWEFHRIVRETRPAYVFGENVPGLLSSAKGRSFGTIIRSLVDLGYCVQWRVLDLQFFGVPQRRRRLLIVGSRVAGGAWPDSGLGIFEPHCLQGDFEQGKEARAALKAVERYDPTKGASFLTYLIGQVWSATVSEKRKRHPLTASGNQRMIVVPLTRADLVSAIDDGYSRVEDEEHIRWAFAEMETWLAGQPSELTITYIGKLSGLRVPDIAAALDVPETRMTTYIRVVSRKFSQLLAIGGAA